MNRQCNVTKRIQTSKGPRYCPVVLSANGRIKPDVVLVGRPRRAPPRRRVLHFLVRGKASYPALSGQGRRHRHCPPPSKGS